ncbi:MAG: RNA polymerase sigma factor [Acidobacteriota bacterium]
MREHADRLAGGLLTVDEQLEREFEERLVESSKLAFRVAFGVLRHHEDAEDTAQEAFARAYRSFPRLRDRNRFRAWLVRLTWRLAINRQRANRRRLSRALRAEAVQGPAPFDTLETRERAAQLWQAIDLLPEKLRLVTVLAGIEGHDLREVAVLLGLPEGTVKSRLFLARRRLKERLAWTRNAPTT